MVGENVINYRVAAQIITWSLALMLRAIISLIVWMGLSVKL